MSVNNICIVELFSRQLQRQGRERKKGLTSQTSNRTSQSDLCYRVPNIGYHQTLPWPFRQVIVESYNSPWSSTRLPLNSTKGLLIVHEAFTQAEISFKFLLNNVSRDKVLLCHSPSWPVWRILEPHLTKTMVQCVDWCCQYVSVEQVCVYAVHTRCSACAHVENSNPDLYPSYRVWCYFIYHLYAHSHLLRVRSVHHFLEVFFPPLLGVLNGPIQFVSARKIWPLLELLAKVGWVLACAWSQNSARMLGFSLNPLPCSVSVICILKTKADLGNSVSCVGNRKHWGNMRAPWMFLKKCYIVLLTFIESDRPEFSPR